MSITSRDETRNQITYDRQQKKVFLFANSYINGDYANISGALESVACGQVMGRVAATGKIVVCKSAAVDGSEQPRFIMVQELTDIAIAGTVDNIAPCNGGQVNVNEIVFDGADTIDTLVGGVRMGDLLIQNSKDLELKNVIDDSQFDN
jgi:hypothetical protein